MQVATVEKLPSEPVLITEEYRHQNAELHRTNDHYGVSGKHYVSIVGNLIRDSKFRSVLDYGAGRCTLHEGIAIPGIVWQDFDPCIPELSEHPVPAELVCCTDVMEHIEPACLEAVLDDLQSLTQKMLLATVSLVPAIKVLPDGRNAHLIQQPYEWWVPKFWSRWTIRHFQHETRAILLICTPKGVLKT